ncbi:MAG: alkaline phosphatase family protein [Candidatus Thorarchaeota archaeon]
MHSELKELPETDDLFVPDYLKNIYRILPTALRCMGIAIPRDDLFAVSDVVQHLRINKAMDAKRVVVCIVDSLGTQNMLGTKMEELFNDLRGIALHSTFPSITSSAIPSITFGVPPTSHGILGHIIYIPEFGTLIDTLRMSGYKTRYRDAIASAGIDVRVLLWTEGLPSILRKTYPNLVVAEGLPREIPGTGLGRFYVLQENIVTFNGVIDAFGMAQRVFNHFTKQKIFMTLYFPQIDTLSHKYGPTSSEYKSGCNLFHWQLRNFVESLPPSEAKETTIVVCSDHGQNPLREDQRIIIPEDDLNQVQGILRVPPGRSGRVTHFYCKSTAKRRTLKRWLQERVENRALILDAKELNQAQLLPVPINRQILQRLGDLLLIARDGANLIIEGENNNRNSWGLLPHRGLLGSHGSLTSDELLTPFLAFNASMM